MQVPCGTVIIFEATAKTMKSDHRDESWLLCHPRAHGPSTPVHTASSTLVRTGHTVQQHRLHSYDFFNTFGIFAK